MTLTPLLIFILLGQTPAADADRFVEQLGSSRFEEREKAEANLERLGRVAVEPLMKGLDSKDLEIRARSRQLLGRIESRMVLEPTLIEFNAGETRLADAVQSFAVQSGTGLSLTPNNPAQRDRLISLNDSGALPFWKALDALCDRGGLQFHSGLGELSLGRGAAFQLFDEESLSAYPTFDTGPFRVTVVNLHYQRDISFPRIPVVEEVRGDNEKRDPKKSPVDPKGAITEEFFVALQVSAEPRLMIHQAGLLKEIEAIDDQGRPMVDANAAAPPSQRDSAYFGMANCSIAHLQISLSRPEPVGRRLARLAGKIPLTVSARKSNPLIIPLENGIGKTFKGDDLSVALSQVRLMPNGRQTLIELSLDPGEPLREEGLPGLDAASLDCLQQQIEVLDQEGKPLPWYPSNQVAEDRKVAITVHSIGVEPSKAVEIRYYSLIKASTDVAFEFADIPLP